MRNAVDLSPDQYGARGRLPYTSLTPRDLIPAEPVAAYRRVAEPAKPACRAGAVTPDLDGKVLKPGAPRARALWQGNYNKTALCSPPKDSANSSIAELLSAIETSSLVPALTVTE